LVDAKITFGVCGESDRERFIHVIEENCLEDFKK
jgi:hypothetical protein